MRRHLFWKAVATVVALSGAVAMGAPPASAASTSGIGTLTGTVTVTGAPSNFSGFIGVGACPASFPKGTVCPNPQYTLVGSSGGTFSLPLASGKWRAAGFYELAGFGGQFIGAYATVTIAANMTTTHNFTVPYVAPGTVSGTVQVIGVPTGVTLESTGVLACPSSDPYTGGVIPIVCVTTSAFGTNYSFTTLPPGPWLLYPQYTTIYGTTTRPKGVQVMVVSGATLTTNLAMSYRTPTQGLVVGTVTVTGAPPGFNGFSGAFACQGADSSDCASPIVSNQNFGGGSTYQVLLTAGTWNVAGNYQLNFSGGVFAGPGTNVTVVPGATTTVNLTVPYVAPGAVIGMVDVTGLPASSTIQEALVLACPAAHPYVPPAAPGPTCAQTSTPLVARYAITTLPPGSWLLYPGYYASTSYYISPSGVPLTVTSNKLTRKNLKVAYQG